MTKQQILGFELAARLEQVADEPYESLEKNSHPGKDATILPRKANPQPDGIFGRDSRQIGYVVDAIPNSNASACRTNSASDLAFIFRIMLAR